MIFLYAEFGDFGKSVRSKWMSGRNVVQGGVDGNMGSKGLSSRCF